MINVKVTGLFAMEPLQYLYYKKSEQCITF